MLTDGNGLGTLAKLLDCGRKTLPQGRAKGLSVEALTFQLQRKEWVIGQCPVQTA